MDKQQRSRVRGSRFAGSRFAGSAVAGAVAAVLSALTMLSAQQPQQEPAPPPQPRPPQAQPGQTPTFRSGVELVTVDVGVVDRSGTADTRTGVRRLHGFSGGATETGRQRRVRRQPGRDLAQQPAPVVAREHDQLQRGRQHRPDVRVRRRSGHARSGQRAPRRPGGLALPRHALVRRSVGADAAALRSERDLHMGARQGPRRASAG